MSLKSALGIKFAEEFAGEYVVAASGDLQLAAAMWLVLDDQCPNCCTEIDLVRYSWCNQYRIGCQYCGLQVEDDGFNPIPHQKSDDIIAVLEENGRSAVVVCDSRKSFSSIRADIRKSKFQENRQAQLGSKNVSARERYAAYLKTSGWRKKRDIILRRDSFLCQSCLTERATEVHHLSYDHLDYDSPGTEPGFDLASICRECHERIHAK